MRIRARAVAVRDGKILLVQHNGSSTNFWALPGGGVDEYESTKETLIREMKEELLVDVKLGKLLFIQELLSKEKDWHSMEFFYEILKPEKLDISRWKESEFAHELSAVGWKDIDDENLVVLPKVVLDELRKHKGELPESWNTKHVINNI